MHITILGKSRAVESWEIVKGAACVAPNVPAGDKNWVATVEFSATSKFGMDRRFWEGGNSSYYAVPADLKPGDYLEYGHDSYSSRGRKSEGRTYFRMLEITPAALLVRESGTPGIKDRALALDLEMLEAARAAEKAEAESPAGRLEATRGRLASARALVVALEAEVASLERLVRVPDMLEDRPTSPPLPLEATTARASRLDLDRWGARGTRYDEACAFCRRVGEIDNETEICRACDAKAVAS